MPFDPVFSLFVASRLLRAVQRNSTSAMSDPSLIVIRRAEFVVILLERITHLGRSRNLQPSGELRQTK